jgi:hypothetical protein
MFAVYVTEYYGPGHRGEWKPRRFTSLPRAKEYADREVERLKTGRGTLVVEVVLGVRTSGRSGRTKSRGTRSSRANYACCAHLNSPKLIQYRIF